MVCHQACQDLPNPNPTPIPLLYAELHCQYMQTIFAFCLMIMCWDINSLKSNSGHFYYL